MAYPYTQNPYSTVPLPYYQQPQPQQQVFYPPVAQNQQTSMVTQQPMAGPTTNIIWVDGPEKAESYPVAIGNTVFLVDYDFKTAYKKSTDLTGKPMPTEVYDLVPRNQKEQSAPQIDTSALLTKDEFVKFKQSIEKKIEEIAENESEMVVVPVKKRGRKPQVVIDAEAEVMTNESVSSI